MEIFRHVCMVSELLIAITVDCSLIVFFVLVFYNRGCYVLLLLGCEGCETNSSFGRNCPRGLRYYKSPELGLNLSGS
jgi:hypothetical protein